MSPSHTSTDILVRTAGTTWRRPTTEGYTHEPELQQILAEQPSLIEGIGESAAARREFSTGVGPADLVIVDSDGTITVVECKLARNEEIRRKIMGQVLDYASRLAEMTPDDFERAWNALAGPSLDSVFEDSPDGRARFESNLRGGTFTLVLAVDAINDDLRRIVRYLNTHTSAGMRLPAIELRRAVHESIEILIPTVYGSESADEKNARRGSSSAVRWTHADVDAWLSARDPVLAEAVSAFRDALSARGFRLQGGGAGTYPSYSMWGAASNGADIAPFSIYCGERPTLGFNFQWSDAAGSAALDRFLEELVAAGLPLDRPVVRQANFRKRISVSLDLLKSPDRRAAVVAAAGRLTDSRSGEPGLVDASQVESERV
ncbi:hypothetical protein ACWKWC_00880 [Geodermatophilus nigrescens]